MKIGCFGRRSQAAVTLIEAVLSMAVGGLMMAGVANGFIQCMRRAEWSSYSLAASSLAMQKLEQTRAAKWDRLSYPTVDDLVSSNFPPDVQVLDIPISKTNIVYATNYTSVLNISTNPPLRMVRVDCVWRFMSRGLFTNTVATYRAPDQ
jgi:hypothetical protein